MDSRADVVFWLSALAAVLLLCPQVRVSLSVMSAALLALELVAPIISLSRFGRQASTHHILSKIFGLGLWALMTVLFIRGSAPWLQVLVFGLGVASQLEAIAIMLVIPAWQADIRSLGLALRLREEARRRSPDPQTP